MSKISIPSLFDTYLPIVYSDDDVVVANPITNTLIDSAAQIHHHEEVVDDDDWKFYDVFIEEDYVYHLDTTFN